MICPVCGKEIADGSTVCPICGAALTAAEETAAEVVETPAAEVAEAPAAEAAAPVAAAPAAAAQPVVVAEVQPMPKNVKQFLKQRENIPEYNKIRKEINASAILFYVFAGLTLLVNVVIAKNMLGFVDVAILAILGIWLHTKYSRTAAIIALVYSIINMIYMIQSTGKPGGYLIVIISVIAVLYTFKGAAAFKKFKANAENAQ